MDERNKDKVRKMLNSYLVWKSDMENIDLEIEELFNNYDVDGISIKENTGHTNKINNVTESKIVYRDDKIEKLEKQRRYCEINCKKVENAIQVLKEFEKEVVELKYMTPPVKSWNTVSRKVGFSCIACQRAEDRAVKKMMELLVK
jgi:DNA-directed RNA polymerase specialized sigma subunit